MTYIWDPFVTVQKESLNPCGYTNPVKGSARFYVPTPSLPGRVVDHNNQLEYFVQQNITLCDILVFPVIGMNNTFLYMPKFTPRLKRALPPTSTQIPLKVVLSKIAMGNKCLTWPDNHLVAAECTSLTNVDFQYNGNLTITYRDFYLNVRNFTQST